MKRLVVLFVLAFFIAGCKTGKTIHTVKLTGDNHPVLTEQELHQDTLSNLSQGESAVFARDSSKEYKSRINDVTINIFKKVERKRTSSASASGSSTANGLDGEDSKPIPTPVIDGAHYIQNGSNWWYHKQIDIDKMKPEDFKQVFRYIVLNTGTADFTGDVTVLGYPDPTLKITKIRKYSMVKDQRAEKQGFAFIPIFGIFALAMDNFKEIDTPVAMSEATDGDRHTFIFEDITLPIGQGIMVEYETDFNPPLEAPEEETPPELATAE